MLSYNDHGPQESSESDIDDENIYKATTGYGKIAKISHNKVHYSSSEESEESPLSDDEEEEQRPSPSKDSHKYGGKDNVIHQRASDSEDSEEEENSIDHIEERIKRLEMDLERKIDKHKKDTVSVGKERPQTAVDREKGKNLKNSGSPPLPKKMEAKVGAVAKLQAENKQHKASKQVEEKAGEAEQYLPAKRQYKNIDQIIDEQKEVKEASPKKKLSKEKKQEEIKNPSFVADKKRIESKGSAKPQPPQHIQSHSQVTILKKQLSKANKQIEQLTKEKEQLKKDNKRLKEQVSSSKKKKSYEEVEKLKEIAADSSDVKLEKQIQLLKIIEGLQAKLKKSINKKLGKSRAGSTSAALLHKGLPSSLMH